MTFDVPLPAVEVATTFVGWFNVPVEALAVPVPVELQKAKAMPVVSATNPATTATAIDVRLPPRRPRRISRPRRPGVASRFT